MIMSTKTGKTGKSGKIGIPALILLASTLGCGQTSFFEVTVTVNNNVSGVRLDCLYAIDQCAVTVSGPVSDNFTLASRSCVHPTAFQLGSFQYGTGEDSGNIVFHVDIFDGNLHKLGQGDGPSTAIKAGGRTPVAVAVVPDASAFAATGSCPP
jgi:hypothetical protein